MRAPLFLLPAIGLTLIAGCGGAGIAEAPVYYTAQSGARVEALSMTTPRADHVAVRLNDGRVLIAGGTSTGDIGGVLSSAELYDPADRAFVPTAAMTVPREGPTATLLADATVLLTGGVQSVGYRSELSSAEIYDPATGGFRVTGSMHTPREGHTATLLRDGRVLIAGGSKNGIYTLDSAEIYDPASRTFSSAGRMTQPRDAHTATLLRNGLVLIAGGGRGDRPGGYIAFDTAEIYDPASGSFSAVNRRMISDRVGAAATLLEDGRVLIVGGKSSRVLMAPGHPALLQALNPLASAEVYDPESRSFQRVGDLAAPHYLPTLAPIDRGRVLVIGGWTMRELTAAGMSDAEVFEPSTSSFLRVKPMETPRLENTATTLENGEVLVAGGVDGTGNVTASVEFYSPNDRRFLARPELASPTPEPSANNPH